MGWGEPFKPTTVADVVAEVRDDIDRANAQVQPDDRTAAIQSGIQELRVALPGWQGWLDRFEALVLDQ